MNELLIELFQHVGKAIFFISIASFYILFLALILKGVFYKNKNK